ncbi:alanine racemase [Paenibacillus sp.]|uniref:alanine racemase n=1 Tax=Paenibacillus sp. TaxID=58172 RepID=UPI00346460BD
METYFRPTRAEISLDALRRNLQAFRSTVPASTKLSVCVKANAYGHGAVEVSRAAEQFGVDYLNVAFMEEAIQLRKAGIHTPILILGYTPPESIEAAFRYDISLNIFSEECIQMLEQHAATWSVKYDDRKLKVHVKVDSGMGRLGIRNPEDVVQVINRLRAIHGVEVEGVFTHFATADEADKSYAQVQRDRFALVINLLKEHEIPVPIIHSSNSAATIDMPNWGDNMVRVGISMYGLYPSAEVNQKYIALEPVLSLKSAVSHCKEVPEKEGISYGVNYWTKQGEWIATMPVGYADGYSRLLQRKALMLIRGQRVPVVGNICMDQCMLSLLSLGQEASTIEAGEEVVLIGRQGEGCISAGEVAEWFGTIHYEVTCMIAHRVPRVYIENGQVVKVSNPLLIG